MTKQRNATRKRKFSPSEPTLIDVAQVAGVSPITVSRALNQPDLVSERAREKVRAAVEQTGYVPNMQAGSLASRNSRLVAVIVPTIAHSIFSDMVQALTDTLSPAGYQTLLGLSGYEAKQEQQLIETILGRRPDGIVLTGTLHTPQSRKRLEATSIPIVETWDQASSPIDSVVGFSHHKVGVSVGNYLLDKGYRNIVAVSANDKRAQKRKRGLLAALKKRGIESVSTITVKAPTNLQAARIAAAELLDQNIPFDAVYCSSDTLAQGVIAELQSRNIPVPAEKAVIGFGDLEFAAHSFPSITSVRINGYEIGRLSADFLLARFAKSGDVKKSSVNTDVGFEIMERQSA